MACSGRTHGSPSSKRAVIVQLDEARKRRERERRIWTRAADVGNGTRTITRSALEKSWA
jgi:hypothetical protein